MTRDLPHVLRGAVATIAEAGAGADGAAFAGARIGAAAMLVFLVAQELDRGDTAEAERQEIEALVAEAARDGHPSPSATVEPRRRLIALHEAVERSGDRAWDARILSFYRAMADRRRIELPG